MITFVPGNLRENLKGGLIECWCLPEKGISGRHQHSIRPPFRIPRDRKHTSNCAHSNEHSRAPCTVDNAFWGSAPLERPAGSAHLSARIGTLWGSQDPLLALVREDFVDVDTDQNNTRCQIASVLDGTTGWAGNCAWVIHSGTDCSRVGSQSMNPLVGPDLESQEPAVAPILAEVEPGFHERRNRLVTHFAECKRLQGGG